MRRPTEASKQKALVDWLKKQGDSIRIPLLALSIAAIVSFILQLCLFWFLSSATQILLIDRNPIPTTLLATLAIIITLLLFIEKIRLIGAEKQESALYAHLQNQLHHRLSQGQFALVREHSTYFWQQIWQSHLPVISRFNVRYLIQQRLSIFAPLIVLICIFPINWLVSLSLLISLPVIPLFMIIIGKGAANLHRKHFKALARMGSIFVDRIKSLEMLRIFQAHQTQSQMLSIASEELNQHTMQVVGVAFLSASVLDFFSTLAIALVAVFTGFNLLGEFTIGGNLNLHTGLFILLATPLCFAELKQLGHLYHLRAEAIAAADDLINILQPPIKKTEEKPMHIDANQFENINWHKFNINTPSIQADNINFKQGDWIFLQGPSGSGKTCFLEGLMGQRNSSHYLKNAVLISQHAVILPLSIRENLSLGHSYSDQELQNALTKLELSDWLKQHQQGLDSVLSEHIPMSGGQKQRLALARALLSKGNIILLDEPTAHLTDEQHQRLSKIIKKTLQGKTVIWVSHKKIPTQWFTQFWEINNGTLTTIKPEPIENNNAISIQP